MYISNQRRILHHRIYIILLFCDFIFWKNKSYCNSAIHPSSPIRNQPLSWTRKMEDKVSSLSLSLSGGICIMFILLNYKRSKSMQVIFMRSTTVHWRVSILWFQSHTFLTRDSCGRKFSMIYKPKSGYSLIYFGLNDRKKLSLGQTKKLNPCEGGLERTLITREWEGTLWPCYFEEFLRFPAPKICKTRYLISQVSLLQFL